MPKVCKLAYGISEDGVNIKLAGLTRDGNQVYLQALDQVEIEKSLYHHLDDKTSEPDTLTDAWAVEAKPDAEINLDDFTGDNMAGYQIQPYDSMFRNYPLNQGVIAVNVNDENLLKLPALSPSLSIKQRNKIVKETLSHSDYKGGEWQSSVLTIGDQTELWIHHGQNSLLDILNSTQQNLKQKYYFQYADANDIALASLFLMNQPPESTDSCMVLYLGSEYRRALIFEGNKWTHSLPIQVTQRVPEIDVLYSKLSLALDEAHVADTKHLLVCGDFCTEDSIIYLRTQLPNTDVKMWTLPELESDPLATQKFNSLQIARNILPIALAWKALMYESPLVIRSSFLPNYVIEGQKVFKIAWHGYLTFGLLFVVSLYLTTNYLQRNLEVKQLKSSNRSLQFEFTKKKSLAEQVLVMAKAIDIQAKNIDIIKTIMIDKNPWTEIVTVLHNSFQSNPVSWMKNIQKNEKGFQVTGITTQRGNVVTFARLFPNGKIARVTHSKMRNTSVWEFDIIYSFPSVDWYSIMEEDLRVLKEYEEKKGMRSGIRQDSDIQTSNKVEPPVASDKNIKNTLKKGMNKIGETVTQQIDKSKASTPKRGILFPVPSKSLLSNSDDPAVQSYHKFYAAFSQKQDWLLVDLGVKFINNYPMHALASYVRWYMSYQNWQSKQYNRPTQWLEPLLKRPDAVAPYAMLLAGYVYRDTGDDTRMKDLWSMLIQDYPSHPTADIARELLGDKK